MTFSIVARDASNGDIGVAVASKFLAVGSVVPYARAGVGAVATQAFANVAFGPDGLDLLADGASAADVLARLITDDTDPAQRQVGVVDAAGGAVTHTGVDCIDWAGGRLAEGVAVQGNILAGAEVVDAMLATFLATGGSLPDRLLAALAAGDAKGGDSRGRQSAALLVVRAGGGYGGANDRWIDLRVDDHPTPIVELTRLRSISALLNERPDASELVPIENALATELKALLDSAGWTPERTDADETTRTMLDVARRAVRVGTPRTSSAAWSPEWDAALITWMAIHNLEERIAAFGWIDPAVLAELQAASDER